MGCSINLSHEPTRIQTRSKKAQCTTHMYMMCKPTHTYLIAQDKQVAISARKYLPKKLQHKYSADMIKEDVNAITHPQSLVMKIKVRTGDASDSVAIANAVARGFQKELPKVQPGAGNVRLLSRATSDDVEVNTTPNKKKYITVGLALGALVGLVVSFTVVTWKRYLK